MNSLIRICIAISLVAAVFTYMRKGLIWAIVVGLLVPVSLLVLSAIIIFTAGDR